MKPVDMNEVEIHSGGSRDFEPDDPPNKKLGLWESRSLGDAFDLTHFGVSAETLAPGSKSAMRHWHTKSDEFIMILEGEFVLVTNDGESVMTPGMIVGFRAGLEDGHHLINRTPEPATLLIIGSRIKGDKAHYPDDDFQWLEEADGTWYAARKDGSRY